MGRYTNPASILHQFEAVLILATLCIDTFTQEAEADEDSPPTEQAPLPPVKRSTSTGRLNVKDLGFYDPVDAFWSHRVDFDQATLSRSEQDLLEELDQTTTACGAQGLGQSEAVSYEDLMEFALDGPRHRCDHTRMEVSK